MPERTDYRTKLLQMPENGQYPNITWPGLTPKHFILPVCLIILALFCGTAYADAPAKSDLSSTAIEAALDSTVTVEVMSGQGVVRGAGIVTESGGNKEFVDNLVVTSAELLEGRKRASVLYKGKRYEASNNEWIDEQLGIGFLFVFDDRLPAAAFGKASEVAVDDKVFAVEVPGTVLEGVVLGKRFADGVQVIDTTAKVLKGGGLFDSKGRLIGIRGNLPAEKNHTLVIDADLVALAASTFQTAAALRMTAYVDQFSQAELKRIESKEFYRWLFQRDPRKVPLVVLKSGEPRPSLNQFIELVTQAQRKRLREFLDSQGVEGKKD